MAVETSQALQHLHHLLQQLEDAEELLAHGPRRIAAAHRKTKVAEQLCVDRKEQIQTLRKAADEKSLNLKSREAEIAKLTGRLNESSSNKEYDIIQAQIESARSANNSLEDEILTLLTQVDEAGSELAKAQEETLTMTRRAKDIEAEVRAKEPGILDDINRLESEITEAENAIPAGEPRSVYQRLRNSLNSSALSEVLDSFCLACNTSVTAQDRVRINMGEFVICRECGRILYTS